MKYEEKMHFNGCKTIVLYLLHVFLQCSTSQKQLKEEGVYVKV